MLKLLSVKPLTNYELELHYEKNHIRRFDVKPYLKIGKFCELQDIEQFNRVHVSFDTIGWDNGVDLCPEVLFTKSIEH